MGEVCTNACQQREGKDHQNYSLLENLLEGLYRDRLFPTVSMLRIQLEQYKQGGDGAGMSVEALIEVARHFPEKFAVETAEIMQPSKKSPILLGRTGACSPKSVTLAKPPQWFMGFIDWASDGNPFSASLWTAFAKYLQNLARLGNNRSKALCSIAPETRSASIRSNDVATGKANPEAASAPCHGPHAVMGGILEAARELQRRRLNFFADVTLAEICHILHLSLHKHKLVVYEDGFIIPAAACATACAATAPRNTCTGTGGAVTTTPVVRTQGQLCTILREVLSKHEAGLDLCKLKSEILELCNVRLNETVFGCTKLSDVLRLPAVAQLCRVRNGTLRCASIVSLRDSAENDYVKLNWASEESSAYLFPSVLQTPQDSLSPSHQPLLATSPTLNKQTNAGLSSPPFIASPIPPIAPAWSCTPYFLQEYCRPQMPLQPAKHHAPAWEMFGDSRCTEAAWLIDMYDGGVEAPFALLESTEDTVSKQRAMDCGVSRMGLQLSAGEPAYVPLPIMQPCS